MNSGSVTYRISPALFAEYCYFTPFRRKGYHAARKVAVALIAAAGILAAIWGFISAQKTVTVLGFAVAIAAIMVPFVQKKYILGRYKTVYGKKMTTYTAEFTKNGTFIISAEEIKEKYSKQDIEKIYYIKGGYAVRTGNKAVFLVPAVNTLPLPTWFAKTYGNKFKVCI